MKLTLTHKGRVYPNFSPTQLREKGVPDAVILNAAKAHAVASVFRFASQTRAAIAGNPDPLEAAGWSEKAGRAERVIANKASKQDRSILTVEAAARGRGESVEAFAKIVSAKALRYRMAEAQIVGMANAAGDAINEAESIQELPDLLDALNAQAKAALEAN